MAEGRRNAITFRGDTPIDLAAALRRGEVRTTKAALRHMRKMAEKVKNDSIANSPVDTHALEDAHHVIEAKGGTRIESKVEVGGVISTDEGAKDVSDYAAEIHENYDYDYKPGKDTLAKRAANPNRHVGGKFLERALEENEQSMDDMLEAIMDDIEQQWERW